jgi:hypothetical protein
MRDLPSESKAAVKRLRVITLVHGTWSANAPWTQPHSKLCQALMQNLDSSMICPFAWSGKNSVQARKRAAEDLKHHLVALFERQPEADHFVIGHSHGGSVALYAMRDKAICTRLRGVVCLSTPFLIAKRRNNIFWNLDTEQGKSLLRDASYAACFGALLLATAAVVAWLWDGHPHMFGTDTQKPLLIVSLGYAVTIGAHFASSVLRKPLCALLLERLRRFADSTADIESELDLTSIDPDGIFIARSIADEASSFIGMSQVISWFVTRIWLEIERLASGIVTEVVRNATPFPNYMYRHFPRTLYGAVRLYLQVVGIYLAVLASAWFLREQVVFAAMGRVAWPLLGLAILGLMTADVLFGMLIITHLVLYSLAPITSFMMTLLCLLPFGRELAIRNILLTVSAESTPKGAWKLELIEPNAPSAGMEVPLSHSEIYDSETGIAKVTGWIRERSAVS